jgi:hypothetical protein
LRTVSEARVIGGIKRAKITSRRENLVRFVEVVAEAADEGFVIARGRLNVIKA